ncbi:CRISPR-associated endoribonuclease Cas6 [Aquiflexum balticum DSM 16537]|uniref:CRISPR-associated endoribonuclease Cas6 n=1 Tax=Aquiflexum balticum DSM 16537 TaxID=758820 RepID=A0A1W2H685_9BACT|nr:CRISPR-associated endoribonuclease Cas6 [Aquiflexum balticum]SMD44435.1 CRISPR-associated endoribonuclease Cas6 [Aquiflexum balticum DSM 16537]
MRATLKLSANTEKVPFDYQRQLVGAFHKWIGENHIHDDVSLYSLSWLMGGKINIDGFDFKYGAEWIISTYESILLGSVIKGIQQDPEINFGMTVKEIVLSDDPPVESIQKFYLNSPIFIKRKAGSRQHYYIFSDKESDMLMTQTLQTKLKKAGLNHEGVNVYFDKTYRNPKTKIISFNGIDCRASMCPIIIEGSPDQIKFAWNVGIGNSTGIGFGALK